MMATWFSRAQWRRALLDGGWLTVGSIGVSLLSTISALVFANLLSQTSYGIYSFILSLGALLSVFSLTGLGTSTKSAIARGRDRTVFAARQLRSRWSLLGTGAGLLGAGYYAYAGNSDFALMLGVISLLLPLTDPYLLYSAILFGKKEYRLEAGVRVGYRFAFVGTVLTSVILTNDVVTIVLVAVVAKCLLTHVCYQLAKRQLTPNTAVDHASLRMGKHVSLMNAVTTVANNFDKVLLFQLLGPAQLASYVFATLAPEQLKGLVKNLNDFLLPRLAQQDIPTLRRTIIRVMFLAVLVLTPVVIIYIVLAPLLFAWLLPQYTDAVVYSQIFSLSLLSTVATAPLSALQSENAHRELYISKIGYSVFGIVALLVGTLAAGIMGAILARVATKYVNLGLLTVLFFRYTKTAVAPTAEQ